MSSQQIKKKAAELGFASCGIIQAAAFDEYGQYLDERVRTFPESKKLYEHFYNFVNPPESAKSIIVCIVRQNRYKVLDSLSGLIGKHYLFDGWLSYSHEHRAGEEFETYLKTCGFNILDCQIPVRWAAVKAGLAKFGSNNFIYSPEHGSFIYVRAWTVDKELDCDAAPQDIYLPECGEGCQRCVRACPTKAMTDGFCMNMGKCAAYLSFRAKDILDETTRSQMGVWLYGCDVCQDVCPANKGKLSGNEEFPLLSQFEEYLQPENILAMDEDTYINIVNPRFWYIGEDGLWLWKCNALRSMINSGKSEYHDLIKGCCNHEDTRLREIAKWGRQKLSI